jgi:hypothetical protein
MAKRYAVTGPDEGDPTYLVVTTDDADLIVALTIPFWRVSDAITQAVVRDWQAADLHQDITTFKQHILDTYGQQYVVRAHG